MVKAIMHGCNGHMGQVITGIYKGVGLQGRGRCDY